MGQRRGKRRRYFSRAHFPPFINTCTHTLYFHLGYTFNNAHTYTHVYVCVVFSLTVNATNELSFRALLFHWALHLIDTTLTCTCLYILSLTLVLHDIDINYNVGDLLNYYSSNLTLETGIIHSCKLNYTKICWTEVQRKLESNYQEGKWLGPIDENFVSTWQKQFLVGAAARTHKEKQNGRPKRKLR